MLVTDIFRLKKIIIKEFAIILQLRKKIFARIAFFNHTIKVQDKSPRFVLLSNKQYCKKVQYQINRSSFTLLKRDSTKTFEDKINKWIEKWISRKAIDKDWKRFIKMKNVKPGKMYRMIDSQRK